MQITLSIPSPEPKITVIHLKVFESTISSQLLMLLPCPIPNPESIFLHSMAITNFADITVIHCVYAHKRMAVRVSHQ